MYHFNSFERKILISSIKNHNVIGIIPEQNDFYDEDHWIFFQYEGIIFPLPIRFRQFISYEENGIDEKFDFLSCGNICSIYINELIKNRLSNLNLNQKINDTVGIKKISSFLFLTLISHMDVLERLFLFDGNYNENNFSEVERFCNKLLSQGFTPAETFIKIFEYIEVDIKSIFECISNYKG